MTKPGKVRENDFGGLSFKFDDGTEADADWVPIGKLGDGQGGGFDEDNVYVCDSGLTAAELVELADKYTGCGGEWLQMK